MPGLSLFVGTPDDPSVALQSPIRSIDDDNCSEYRSPGLQVYLSALDESDSDQPATAEEGEIRIWIHGELFGFDDGPAYVPRDQAAPDRTDSEYIEYLYDRFGLGFLPKLNGEFVGCIFDPAADTMSVFTDRLGSRPIYYATTDTGNVVLSTHLRALADYPGLDTSFDVDYLYEYLALRRVFGTKTAISGVETVPPATVMSVDVTSGAYDFETYWSPTYRPLDRPYREYVTEFASRFQRVVQDRVRPGESYGVLLSGGADSRLILAALDQCDVSAVALHVNDHLNREARIARRVARTAGIDFRFLERDADYVERTLERDVGTSEYVSWFNQAHFSGVADEIRDEVDVVLAGEFAAETVGVFDGFPDRRLDAGFLPQRLPVAKPIATVDEYIDHVAGETPAYLDVPPTVVEVLQANIRSTGTTVEHHGVSYDSLQDLLLFAELYPATNDADYLNYRSLIEQHQHWTPFFDKRIVDFTRRYPIRYRLRRNIVHDAVRTIAPELASIPNANTGIDLTHSFPVEYAALQWQRFKRKYLPSRRAKPWYTDYSWPDHEELIRRTPTIAATIEQHRETITQLPFIDYDRVIETLDAHRSGEDRRAELYTLVTFLETPTTSAAVEGRDDQSTS